MQRLKLREPTDRRRDVADEAVAAEVEVHQRFETVDVGGDWAGEVVLGKVEEPEVGAVVQ